jgi:hypothetical protein
MTTIIYQEEFQEDIDYFKTMRDKMAAQGENTEKIDKQIAILEDSIVLYKLSPRDEEIENGSRTTSLQ